MAAALTQALRLHNGVEMPVFGLGTWQIPDGAPVIQACRDALEAGYRHIDTAAGYNNEKGVGQAVRESGLAREDIFVTTKLGNPEHRNGYDACLKAFDDSFAKLHIGPVDLYLIHWPCPGKYHDAWRALENIYASGRARAIGVSNFLPHHLTDLLTTAEVVPMVDQVEFHPRLMQKDLMTFLRRQKIVQESWSPLMQGKVLAIPELQEIAKKHHKTVAQVVIRWNIQHDVVVIPKSTHRERIVSNAQVFDFELSADDMKQIDALDQDKRVGPHPDHFNF